MQNLKALSYDLRKNVIDMISVGDIGMADRPVCEKASGSVKRRRFQAL
mgnify:CR=1 FL=1